MNVVIVGYGQMGKEIESVLLQRNHTIAARIDPAGGEGVLTALGPEALEGADAAIEFSLASGVRSNVELYAKTGTAAVIGTTGWEDLREEVERIASGAGIGLVHGSNFSIGAHLFFSLAAEAARLTDSLPEYDIMLYELHHSRKKDSPSGTALTAARRIIEAGTKKRVIQTERLDRQIGPEELHVASVRGGAIPGVHTVLLDSPADTIEITHTARSRGGFALGAVMAAEWVAGKHGVFRVEEFVAELLSRR